MDEDSKDGLDNKADGELIVDGDLTVDCSLICFSPHITSFTFELDGAKGELFMEDGKLKFKGDFDASAKILFDNYLKPLCDDYIKERLDNGTTKAPTNSPEAHNGD